MTAKDAGPLLFLGAVTLAVACFAAWHRPPRPPVPDAMPAALEAERRVVYLIHDPALEPGPLMCGCELAARPDPRRAQR